MTGESAPSISQQSCARLKRVMTAGRSWRCAMKWVRSRGSSVAGSTPMASSSTGLQVGYFIGEKAYVANGPDSRFQLRQVGRHHEEADLMTQLPTPTLAGPAPLTLPDRTNPQP